jgi:hypothetical protein
MDKLFAFCDNSNCQAIFQVENIFNFGEAHILNLRLENNTVKCPVCKGNAKILDGIYNYTNSIYNFVDGPLESIEKLERLKQLLRQNLFDEKSREQVINEIALISNSTADFAKKVPQTISKADWIQIILAFITLVITIQQSYFKKDESLVQEKYIKLLMEERRNYNREVVERMSAPKRINRKQALNSLCECRSGKLYKRCCYLKKN